MKPARLGCSVSVYTARKGAADEGSALTTHTGRMRRIKSIFLEESTMAKKHSIDHLIRETARGAVVDLSGCSSTQTDRFI